MNALLNSLQTLTKLFINGYDSQIPDEVMEEYRMISGFKPKEICRLHDIFYSLIKDDTEFLSKDTFLSIECLNYNPLKERIASCFGYDAECDKIDFRLFLKGLALFNGPGQIDSKLKTAFKIQDFDEDGVLNKGDLIKYLKLITPENALSDDELERVATTVLEESSSDEKAEHLTFTDFQRVVAFQDLSAKLLIPI